MKLIIALAAKLLTSDDSLSLGPFAGFQVICINDDTQLLKFYGGARARRRQNACSNYEERACRQMPSTKLRRIGVGQHVSFALFEVRRDLCCVCAP